MPESASIAQPVQAQADMTRLRTRGCTYRSLSQIAACVPELFSADALVHLLRVFPCIADASAATGAMPQGAQAPGASMRAIVSCGHAGEMLVVGEHGVKAIEQAGEAFQCHVVHNRLASNLLAWAAHAHGVAGQVRVSVRRTPLDIVVTCQACSQHV